MLWSGKTRDCKLSVTFNCILLQILTTYSYISINMHHNLSGYNSPWYLASCFTYIVMDSCTQLVVDL